MRWLWYVGPVVVALVYLWSALWPTRRQRVRAAELRRWVDELLGPLPATALDDEAGRKPQRLVGLLPRAFGDLADLAGLGTTVGNVVLVPKLAYLTVRDANGLAGSDHQCVLFKLAKPAPRMVIRPLPVADGRRQENRGIDVGDPEMFELFEIDGDDAKAIKRWLAPSIRRALCELPNAWLRVEGKMAALSTYGFADADGLDALVDAADAIFAKRGAGKAPSLFGAEPTGVTASERRRAAPPALASIRARAAAFGVDLLLFAAATGLLIAAIALREEGLEGLPGVPIAPKDEFDGPWQAGWNTKGVGALVAAEAVLVGLFVFQTYFAARRGQTLGMRLLGLKAVRLDGGPVDFFRGVLLRGWIIAAVPLAVAAAMTRPFRFGAYLTHLVDPKVLLAAAAAIVVDVVLILLSDSRRALHDYVAGTKVVTTTPDLFAALRRS